MSQLPLGDALDLLVALGAEGTLPEAALVRLKALRDRYPAFEWELIWDEQVLAERFDYDLLIGRADLGTVSLGLAPIDGVPFPLRGVQRHSEMEVARVNGHPLRMYEAAPLIDTLWSETRVHQKIIDHALLKRELAADPVPISDEELQRGVDEFRRARGLATPEATERWLTEHGLTLAGLEALVEYQLGVRAVQRRVVGQRAEAAFCEDPSAFEEVGLVSFLASNADALVSEIRSGASFFDVAERELRTRGGVQRAARSVLFETMRRSDIETSSTLVEGAVVVARLQGFGPYAARVRSITPATWDERTRDAVEERLFADWLARRREGARVEWNWGAGRPET